MSLSLWRVMSKLSRGMVSSDEEAVRWTTPVESPQWTVTSLSPGYGGQFCGSAVCSRERCWVVVRVSPGGDARHPASGRALVPRAARNRRRFMFESIEFREKGFRDSRVVVRHREQTAIPGGIPTLLGFFA